MPDDSKSIEPVTVKITGPPKIKKNDKIKVLWYSDFLRHTGFGNVAEEILGRLQATGKYDFEVVGINYMGKPYNVKSSDYYKFKDIPVHPAGNLHTGDIFGYQKLSALIARKDFDLLFVLQDTFNLIPLKNALQEAKKRKDFRYIFYFPVDGDLKKEWVSEAIQIADFPVVYTKFGMNKVHEINPSINLQYLYHGADLETFKPFKTEVERKHFRKTYFLEKDNNPEFIITNVNRNQPRKDLPRFMAAFVEFCKRYPEIPAKLYLHCRADDMAGHKLKEIAKQYFPKNLLNRLILPDPEMFGSNGYPIDMIRRIYAASDVVSSTTLGEGWGLSTTESMACKVPVVMPKNTSTIEIIGDNEERGYFAKSGSNINLFTTMKHDNELQRPLTDIESLISKWKHVYYNPEEAKSKAEEAYKWLQEITWDKIAQKWDEIFQKAYDSIKK